MKSYQKAQKPVKESVEIVDTQALLETAADGLLNLSVELGMQVVRQLLEADATALYAAEADMAGSAYVYTTSGWQSDVDTSAVTDMLANHLGLRQSGSDWIRYDGNGHELYRLAHGGCGRLPIYPTAAAEQMVCSFGMPSSNRKSRTQGSSRSQCSWLR